MEKFTLFCLPYAGGNKYSYREYLNNAPSFVNLVPLDYPGRGGRISEPLSTDINYIVDELYEEVKPLVKYGAYAIYGHSMGGLAACLLTRKIVENDRPQPSHVFITGTSGPASASRESKKRHILGKSELIEEIKGLNGSSDEIFQNEELLDYLLPILRADFEASETFRYREKPPLNVPFTVITGADEDLDMDDIRLWQKETLPEVDFQQLPGGHFFIFNYAGEIMDVIVNKMTPDLKPIQL